LRAPSAPRKMLYLPSDAFAPAAAYYARQARAEVAKLADALA